MGVMPAFWHWPEGGQLVAFWERFLPLHIGWLALLGGTTSLRIVELREERARERKRIAALAFLPEAFSELCGYCERSVELLGEALERAYGAQNNRTPLTNRPPELPPLYRTVFKDLVEWSVPDVAEYLSQILVKLQVHQSRMASLAHRFRPNVRVMVVLPPEIHAYLMAIGTIRGLINKNFEFARGEGEFDSSQLTGQECLQGLGIDRFRLANYKELEDFVTQRF